MAQDLQNAGSTSSPTTLVVAPGSGSEIPGPNWVARAVPLAPILLALTVASVARLLTGSAPPPMKMNGSGDPTAMPELIGAAAPDFSLRDVHREESDPKLTLSLLCDKGPVVIIFYRGYSCPRCMSKLVEMAGDYEAYQKAGIQVLAISPDMPAKSRDSIATFGDLPFPMLSDPQDKVAKAYKLEAADGEMLHGAFIVDTQRRIQFAFKDEEPYADTQNLLETATALKTGK